MKSSRGRMTPGMDAMCEMTASCTKQRAQQTLVETAQRATFGLMQGIWEWAFSADWQQHGPERGSTL